MARFKHYDYGQMKLLPVSFQEQILPGTFEYTLNHLIDREIDQAVFEHRYQNDETGAPAYDPAILLKVILYAYSRGVTSSRSIERLCRENVVFMALAVKFTGAKRVCAPCPLRAKCLRHPDKTPVRQVVFFTGASTDRPKTYTAKMKRKIDTEHGRYQYGRRLAVAEPVFAKGIYEIKLADQVDPARTNIGVPNTIQRVLPYGADDPWVTSHSTPTFASGLRPLARRVNGDVGNWGQGNWGQLSVRFSSDEEFGRPKNSFFH